MTDTTPNTAANGGQILTDDDPAELWARIYRLEAAVKGPDGFATWQEAATDERIRRVKAEAELESQKRMFMAACEDLGAINEDLGLDPNDGGAEPIIAAIADLRAAAPAPVSGMPDLAKLAKWSYSPTMGVMVPNSPRPRRKFYAVEDVEALFPAPQAPDTPNPTGETK